MTLVNQPTSKPTRKMQAVGAVGIFAPLGAAGIALIFPDLSEACRDEAGLAVSLLLAGFAQGAATFITGYMRRNEARYG